MKVLVAQLDPVIGDFAHNLRGVLAAIHAARVHGARLVVTPELAACGYPPKDLLTRGDFLAACASFVETVAARTAGTDLVVVLGAPVEDAGLRNAAVICANGRVEHVVHKSLLPVYDVFDEPRWFRPGRNPGPIVVNGIRLGVSICEDAWNDEEICGKPGGPPWPYPEDPFDRLGGCDVVVNLSASPFHVGKGKTRLEMLQRKARRVGAPIVYVNQACANDELIFDGESWVVAADGAVIHQSASFTPGMDLVDLAARVTPTWAPAVEQQVHALVMGIRDYAARTGFTRAVLGLSGGIDSAVVAVLAARALGPENVLGVAMPGPFSSEGSLSDARALADALGIELATVPISPIHDAFLAALGPVFGDRPADLAEENLQARARGSVLMGISNKDARLLLTTGNKSEMAVGYCTLYGDMNGALAVIGDLYKTEVYALARHLNVGAEVIPASTITKPPSAELRPNQTDQDSLPPYDVLDSILRRLVEEVASVDAVVAEGFDPALVRRVAGMLARSEFKRWQAAPVLRVSPKAFGTGRRLPLATRWA